jgi:MFS family permease
MEATEPEPVEPHRLYTTNFWLAYAANLLLVSANSLTFRFAEFVSFLGGAERTSGQIVSAGLIAAVCIRLWLGQAMDRYGTRRVWLSSGVFFLLGSGGLLLTDSLTWTIWVARISYAVGLAGMFSSSIVHIQNQVPPHRRTEAIASLGSSGFLGTILGTQLGDVVFRWLADPTRFTVLFAGTTLLGLLHGIVVWRLTAGDRHERPTETPGAFALLHRYWPGMIVLVAVAMGTTFSVTTVFLTRYATSLGIRGIGTFFLGYSLSAFLFRLLTRRWGETVGRHQMVLIGLASLTVGSLLFLGVTSEWRFLMPALVCGLGHALLFPAVVSLGAGRFPSRYRGSGTTLVLGFIEIGTIVSAPLLGAIIDHFDQRGYTQMFYTSATVCAVVGVLYLTTSARQMDVDFEHNSSALPDNMPPSDAAPDPILSDTQG